MINQFLSKFTKNKLYVYPKNYYYENIFEKYRDKHYYLELITKVNSQNKVNSSRKIQLIKGRKNSELQKTDILSSFGTPDFKIGLKDNFGIKIFFYTQLIGNYKVRVEFHFCEDALFLYSYTFPNINSSDQENVLRILKEKYVVGSKKIPQNSCIIDTYESIISIDQDIDFTISYLSMKCKAVEKIRKYFELQEQVEENIIEVFDKNLYERL
ncbi:MAG: hypothetical protein LAT67_12105 [Balneolales bacterium]|nr:hypothetical protein [Balneolales bacterium]